MLLSFQLNDKRVFCCVFKDVYSWEGENFSEFLGMKSEHMAEMDVFFCGMSL